MSNPVKELSRVRGDNCALSLKLLHPDTGAAFNPTGYVLLFTVKQRQFDADSAAKIQKLSTAGGFTIVTAASGDVKVLLVPQDSKQLATNLAYYCDVRAQHGSTGEILTVFRGTLTFDPDVAREFELTIPTIVITPDSAYLSAEQIEANRAAAEAAAQAAAGAVSAHAARADNPHGVTKGQIGLGNVDDTPDADKPVSTAQAAADAAVAAAAALALSTHTARADNPHGVTKGQIGLGNVDDTSDATKNAAAATLTNKTISGLSNTLSNIGNASLVNSSLSIAGVSVSLGSSITRDAITGVSSNGLLLRTAANTLAALSGTSAQYVRADGTVQTLNQAAVAGLTTSSTPTFQGLNLFRTGANADAQIITTTSGRAGLTLEGFGTGTSLSNVGHAGAILALRERTGIANYFSLIYGQDASGSNVAGLAFVAVDDATNKGNVAVLTRAAGGNLALAATFDEDDLTVGGNITAAAFSGSGASLSSLNASNLASGTVPDARLRTALYSRGKAVYVDSVNGNDGTGARGRADLPFLTLAAAKTAAASGDTIYVGPGAYTVSANLAKNGVNWHFYPGATVTRGAGDSGINQGIFDDRDTFGAGEAVVFTVSGAGAFVAGDFANVLTLSRSGSRVSFWADSVQSDGTSFDVSGAAECTAFVRTISAPSCGVGNGTLSISCDYFAGTMSAASGGVISITADELEGLLGPVVQSGDGAINIRARKVGICYTSAGAAVLNIVAESVAGIEMSGGQVSVKALTVGYVYADDVDTDAYINANEIHGNLTAGGHNAAVHVADAGSIASISLRIVNARISNSSTSADHYPIRLDTAVCAGLKLQGVTIIANAAVSESIAATSGSKAKIYGAVANKAVSANLTQQVGTVTVDANVD